MDHTNSFVFHGYLAVSRNPAVNNAMLSGFSNWSDLEGYD